MTRWIWLGGAVLSWAAMTGCGDDGASSSEGGAGGSGGSGSGASPTVGGAGGGTVCTPSCDARECGSDGCEGSCGTCDATLACNAGLCVPAAKSGLSFFLTSVGNKSGDFGGIAGADAFCADLAEAAGVTDKTWKAYLSTSNEDARDRIGAGPWVNAKGVVVASDVASLHANGIPPADLVDEFGEPVPTDPLDHDIMTGSNADGTKHSARCDDWTSSAAFEFLARVGHADANDPVDPFDNWNSTHESGGCDLAGLESTAGTGRIYCFAL